MYSSKVRVNCELIFEKSSHSLYFYMQQSHWVLVYISEVMIGKEDIMHQHIPNMERQEITLSVSLSCSESLG